MLCVNNKVSWFESFPWFTGDRKNIFVTVVWFVHFPPRIFPASFPSRARHDFSSTNYSWTDPLPFSSRLDRRSWVTSCLCSPSRWIHLHKRFHSFPPVPRTRPARRGGATAVRSASVQPGSVRGGWHGGPTIREAQRENHPDGEGRQRGQHACQSEAVSLQNSRGRQSF